MMNDIFMNSFDLIKDIFNIRMETKYKRSENEEYNFNHLPSIDVKDT